MPKITSGDPRPARGRKRQTELAAAMTKAIEVNSGIMLAGLGRPYSIGEKFIAEAICELHFRALRLREAGRADITLLREACQLQQGSVFACLNPTARPLPMIDPSPGSSGMGAPQ